MKLTLPQLTQFQDVAQLDSLPVSEKSKFSDSLWDFFTDDSLVPPCTLTIYWEQDDNIPIALVDELKLIGLLLFVEKGLKPITVVNLVKAFRKFLVLACKETSVEVSGKYFNTIEYLCDLDFDLLSITLPKYPGKNYSEVLRVLRFIPGCNYLRFLGSSRSVLWTRRQIDALPRPIIQSKKRLNIYQLDDNVVQFLIRNATYLAALFMYKLTQRNDYRAQFEINRLGYKSCIEDINDFAVIFDYIRQLRTDCVTAGPITLRKIIKEKTGIPESEIAREIYLIQSACHYLILQFSGMRYSEIVNVKHSDLVEGPFGILLIKGRVIKNRSRHITNVDSWATIPLTRLAFDSCRIINEMSGQDRIVSTFLRREHKRDHISNNILNGRMTCFLIDVDIERRFSNAPQTEYLLRKMTYALPEFRITTHRIRHTVANQLVKGGLNVAFLSAHFKHMSMSLYALLSVPDVTLGYGNISYEILQNKQLSERAFREIENIIGESDELDHLNPEQIDQGIRSKLTTHFRTKLTTLIRAN